MSGNPGNGESYRFRKALGITERPGKFNVNDLMVITVLREFCREKNECWPKLETICKDSMLSKRAVLYSLNKLEKYGMIARDSAAIEHDKRRKKFTLNLAKICELPCEDPEVERCTTCTNIGAPHAPKSGDRCTTCTNIGAPHAPIKVHHMHLNEPCIIEEKRIIKEHYNLFFREVAVPEEKKKNLLSLMEFFEDEVARLSAGQEVSEGWIRAGQKWLVGMAPVLAARGQADHHAAEVTELVRRFIGSPIKYFENQLAYALSGGYRLPIDNKSIRKGIENEAESYRQPDFKVFDLGKK